MTAEAPRSIRVTIPGVGIIEGSAANPIPVHFRALMKQDERQQFWSNRSWPEDAYGKVFLARAAIRVGEALFPNEWTGLEPSADTRLAPLPMFSSLRPWQIREAMQAVPVPERLAMPDPVDQRNWDKAVAIRSKALAEIEGPRKRWGSATFRLREAMKVDPTIERGVRFHFLNDLTGDFSPALPHKWWNTTENWQARFYWCQINPQQPITAAVGGKGFHRIFVDEADLVALIRKIVSEDAPAFSGSRQREFRALLSEAIRNNERNPHNRRHWQDRARTEFGIVRDDFDVIWSDLTTGTKWILPGAKPKSAGAA